jgi:hypothetical protein
LRFSLGRTVRAWHKWLALLAGVQVLIWTISGFYMVTVDLDFIHGDTLVRDAGSALSRTEAVLSVAAIADQHKEVRSATLKSLPGFPNPVYELRTRHGSSLIDAVSGELLSPLGQEAIEALANAWYAGRGHVVRSELLQSAPVEVRGRPVPLWKVDFDDAHRTSFYFDPLAGTLITRRHRWWRVFDTFWMLHVMDYGDERDDVNNTLLQVTSGLAVVFGLTGSWLVYFSFRRSRVATPS